MRHLEKFEHCWILHKISCYYFFRSDNGILVTERFQRDSLAAQMVKNLPAMQETWVQSLGWEDLLEKEKATHSSILAWRIPWTVWSMGVTKSQTQLSDFYIRLQVDHPIFPPTFRSNDNPQCVDDTHDPLLSCSLLLMLNKVQNISTRWLCMLSRFSHVWLSATLWTAASQVPLSMGFSKQEY